MKLIILLVVCLSVGACAPLTKTQVKLTRNYFEAVSNQPTHYRKLHEQIAEISLTARNLESSLHQSDSLRIAALVTAINIYESELELPDTIKTSLRVIDTYIQNYYLLIPDGFDAYLAIKSASESIVGFFGLRGLVSSLFPDIRTNTNAAKKRKIRWHLINSEQKVLASLRHIKSYLDDEYLPRLIAIDMSSRQNFESLFITMQEKSDALNYYTRHNPLFTSFYRKLFSARRLATTLSNSIELFILAEGDVLGRLQHRHKITPESPYLHELLRDGQKIKLLMQEVQGNF